MGGQLQHGQHVETRINKAATHMDNRMNTPMAKIDELVAKEHQQATQRTNVTAPTAPDDFTLVVEGLPRDAPRETVEGVVRRAITHHSDRALRIFEGASS